MLNLINRIKQIFTNFHVEHENAYAPENNYTSYEVGEEAYIIATSDNYGEGIYYNEHNPNEYFIKKMMDDGKISIGFDELSCVDKTLFVSTQDGGMVKDDDTWVSKNQAEIYLTNADSFGYVPFVLHYIENDNALNATLWYRQSTEQKPETKKRGRKKKNV